MSFLLIREASTRDPAFLLCDDQDDEEDVKPSRPAVRISKTPSRVLSGLFPLKPKPVPVQPDFTLNQDVEGDFSKSLFASNPMYKANGDDGRLL
ncbi:hypothetical protein BASA81_001691 [Batrachochytrium salamandrivorans]|nr:hypothetical protein BASA81_001691 [Batrachochytrium salamandrivorans]